MKDRTRPADILVPRWDLGKPAALDLTVTSTLNSSTLLEAGVTCGSAALAVEVRKHNANHAKCSELGGTCIPIAVETYECCGAEALQTLSHLASRLATRGNCSKSHATCLLYGRLSLTLMQASARALMSRAGSSVEDPLNLLYISPFICVAGMRIHIFSVLLLLLEYITIGTLQPKFLTRVIS